MRKIATTALAAIALAGEWITTTDGRRVCQLAHAIEYYQTLLPGFCMSWQPGFVPLEHRGQPYPFGSGWIRKVSSPNDNGYGTLQLHIEGKGWVP